MSAHAAHAAILRNHVAVLGGCCGRCGCRGPVFIPLQYGKAACDEGAETNRCRVVGELVENIGAEGVLEYRREVSLAHLQPILENLTSVEL